MLEEEVRKIEEELKTTKYNKATQGHIGKLKAKLAQLKEESEKKSRGRKGFSYAVKKSGDATVLLVGNPSVGKSTLLNRITSAESKTADYDFTTLDIIPGIMNYNGARIQILDIPGIISEASSGKGRGKEVLSVVRMADLILIMAAGEAEDKIKRQIEIIEKELYLAGFRLNSHPPYVKIYKKSTGGIKVSSTVRLKNLSREEIISILNEFSIYNAEVLIRDEINADQLIDSIMKNRLYVPALIVVNKSDLLSRKLNISSQNIIHISALKDANLEPLKEKIWERLGLIRVYLKRIGKDPDSSEPLILRNNSTIKEACEKIHRRFVSDFRFARVWGSSKFPGQKVGIEYGIKDKDIIELHV